MNHRKHKQSENLKKSKKIDNYFDFDKYAEICPYCGKSGKSCSYVNSVSRAWARSFCKKNNNC